MTRAFPENYLLRLSGAREVGWMRRWWRMGRSHGSADLVARFLLLVVQIAALTYALVPGDTRAFRATYWTIAITYGWTVVASSFYKMSGRDQVVCVAGGSVYKIVNEPGVTSVSLCSAWCWLVDLIQGSCGVEYGADRDRIQGLLRPGNRPISKDGSEGHSGCRSVFYWSDGGPTTPRGPVKYPLRDQTECFGDAQSGTDQIPDQTHRDQTDQLGPTPDPLRTHSGSTPAPLRTHSGSTPDPLRTRGSRRANCSVVRNRKISER
jgi:hypothetical protein